jgi:urease accessory protein
MTRSDLARPVASGSWLLILLAATPIPSLAHTGINPTAGFGYGLMHPLTGLDHILAALGIGLWAALQAHPFGRRLPLVFLGALLAGLPLGAFWPAAATETGVLVSVLLLGVVLVLLLRTPAAFSLLLVALVGLAHGHVHGTEILPGAGLSYATGLLLSTALLVGGGYSAGRFLHRYQAIYVVRYVGLILIAATAVLL